MEREKNANGYNVISFMEIMMMYLSAITFLSFSPFIELIWKWWTRVYYHSK